MQWPKRVITRRHNGKRRGLTENSFFSRKCKQNKYTAVEPFKSIPQKRVRQKATEGLKRK